MKNLAMILGVIGILVVLAALAWHIVMAISAGQPLIPSNSSPSALAVFGNTLILIAVLVNTAKK